MSTLHIPTFSVPTQIEIFNREFDYSESIVCADPLDIFIPESHTEIKDCKIYIPSDCLVSRHDVKKYCELYNCKRVLDPAKADYIIINNTYFPEISRIKVWCNIHHDIVYTNGKVNAFYNTYSYKQGLHLYIYPSDYTYVFNNQHKLIHSKVILTQLYNNANLSIIDEKFYITLDNLFESNTEEEITLAVSLIENCNIKKSLMFLLLLLYNHSRKIYEYDLQKRVKFISMFNFIINDDITITELNKHHFFEILEKHNCLTRYNINILMKFVKNYVEYDLKSQFCTEDIIIKLSLSDYMINKIKENEVNPNQLSLFSDGTN